jgi:uncharacterized OB-fold protein
MSELPAPAPTVSPEAKAYWDATAEGRLLLQRCSDCEAVVWYPRGLCPACGGTRLEWFEASGRGTVYSFTVIRRGAAGPYAGTEPYVLAYVELEEGPRVLTNVVDCDPGSVSIGDAVSAVFHDTGEGSALVRFRPA